MTHTFKRWAHFIHKKMTLFREAAAATVERGAGARGGAGRHLPPSCPRPPPPWHCAPAAAQLTPPCEAAAAAINARSVAAPGTKERLFRAKASLRAAAGTEPGCVRPPRPRPGVGCPPPPQPPRPGLSSGPSRESGGACAGRRGPERTVGSAGGRARCTSSAAARVRGGAWRTDALPPLPGAPPAGPWRTPDIYPTLTAGWGPRVHVPRTPALASGAHPGVGGRHLYPQGRESRAGERRH